MLNELSAFNIKIDSEENSEPTNEASIDCTET